MKITHLGDGGIIPVYRCTAACRHCLYGCSNRMNDHYITPQEAEDLCGQLVELGCRSVHIGGGEPFINLEALTYLVSCIRRHNLELSYIETNASWCAPSFYDDDLKNRLKKLKQSGADCLLISVDPFHVEFIPLERPLRLAGLCEEVEMNFFIWRQEYVKKLSVLEPSRKYSRQELEMILGEDYIANTAKGYGITPNGRALNIFREEAKRVPLSDILRSGSCREITNVNHYHADFDGYLIPPGCTGIGVPLSELKSGIDNDRFPVFTRLASGGVRELYEYACGYGFAPNEDGYTHKCELCYDCRRFLIKTHASEDIRPADYYEQNF